MSPLRKTSPRRRKSARADGGRRASLYAWAVAAAAVALFACGLAGWLRTPDGRASLLRLGADRYQPEAQRRLDAALAGSLPGYVPGPAAADAAAGDPGAGPSRKDWPLPDGNTVYCRSVGLPEGWSLWEAQEHIARAVAPERGEVIWGERLVRPRPAWREAPPGETGDVLRLDLGVAGRPTHTLLLYPFGTSPPTVRWRDEAMRQKASDLLGPPGPTTVAIVVDDWGNRQDETTRGFARLDLPLTFSILPGLRFSRHDALQATPLALPAAASGGTAALAAAARRRRGLPVELTLEGGRREKPPVRRREVILHLPMEPEGWPQVNPGKHPVRVGMSRAEIAAVLDSSLAGLPQISGLNNHMGSAATADRPTMHALAAELAARGLFFLDSMTTSASVAADEMRAAGVPTLTNRLFLDQPTTSRDQVHRLLTRLMRAAKATGSAVCICHPYPQTLDVLQQELPRYRAEGVRFVTLSELLALRREAAAAESTP